MRRSTRAALTVVALTMTGIFNAPSRTFAKDTESDLKSSKAETKASSDLPACLEKLNLNDDQKTKVREICRKYDAKIEANAKSFNEKYLATVRAEVVLMASIEDQLTESQRESLRAERRKSAHSDTSADHQNSNSKPTDDKSAKQTNEKSSNQEKSKSAVIVEEIDEYVLGNGIVLTVEQEAIADKISSSHFRHLRKLHRQIRTIHDRLVALESDKLAEIEKVLTKEQITQLRSERQSSSHHNVTSTDK